MDRNAGMFQDRKDTGHRLAAAFSRDKDGVLGDGYGTDHQDLFDFRLRIGGQVVYANLDI